MSAEWHVDAKNAKQSAPRNTGVQIVTSLRCPEVFHGSLVIRTSPGTMVSTGHAARKCFMASAMELMWPGVPVTACATMKPRRSKTPADRSPAPRTMEANNVPMRAAAPPLTRPTTRLQQMSRVTGSIMSFPLSVWPASCAAAGDHGGLAERHDRTRLLHPPRVSGERRPALGLREVARVDHLAAAALDHHAPHAGRAEEVRLPRADRGDLG